MKHLIEERKNRIRIERKGKERWGFERWSGPEGVGAFFGHTAAASRAANKCQCFVYVAARPKKDLVRPRV